MEQTQIVNQDKEAEQVRIDFKMVTFTLAGKDYGIDIMKVKEISKANKFTFVPNAAPFVRGVYNLRGDIISVIDLRHFFNLPNDNLDGNAENMIILRLSGHVIAVIVDSIDKVVGISSDSVQPPHPLFGDINIKYINGVVENDSRLYVILDVERIFGTEEQTEQSRDEKRSLAKPAALPGTAPAEAPALGSSTADAVRDDVDIGFIEETLVTFQGYHPSPVNQDWIKDRFASWKKQRGDNVQLTSDSDAEAYLAPFFSPFTGNLWSSQYLGKIAGFLPKGHRGNFQIWNPGCGSGHETYSLACMVRRTLPEVHLRIVAQDNDLIRISTAPGLVVDPQGLDAIYEPYLTEGNRGRQFKKEIKDSILFEYHDVTHDNTLPKLDCVVIRDTISFLSPDKQFSLFRTLEDAMKPGGLLVLGHHEKPIDVGGWETIENDGVLAYKKI